ncbi:hypothetical protein HHI36_012603 [Cryptolaemus montrouzieri]|uniref:Uncharacterized protein n=1 Tax=Cryptolaemus montrouzieri TaxID=559131 RepID=A0ABD2NEY8_9CUCU
MDRASMMIILPFHATISLLGIVMIILLCSSVTKEGEHLLYLLHQMEEDSINANAKSIAIQLVENMPLKFSAARFFNISKYTILGIIGNCTTYFIVLIQFHQNN